MSKKLLKLLEVEHTLRKGQSPFICTVSLCSRFGQFVRKKDCQCYDDKEREHTKQVREALE